MNRASLFLATVLLFGFTATVSAGTSFPMVMSLYPVALQAGAAGELTVQSRYTLNGTSRVLVSGTGVTGEVVDAHSTLLVSPRSPRGKKARKRNDTIESLKIRFRADKNALPGIRDFRLAGRYGASTVGQLVVVRDPVVSEAKENDTAEHAQLISLPAAVCGAIEKLEDRDFYKFHVEAGQSLVFLVHGMALENRIHDLQMHLDPIITLRSAAGATLAVCDNDISGDPLLRHRFDRAGDYTLEIRDVRYNGNRDWVYCIEINDRPFVRTVFPLGVNPGRAATFSPVVKQVPQFAAVNWNVPSAWISGFHETQLPLKGGLSNPVALVASDLPLVSETNADNDSVKTAQTVSIPVGINGRIEKEDDADVYAFRAKKGESLNFEVVARRRGSPLDSILRLVDAKGRRLAEGDDQSEPTRTSADSVIESWRAPADGTYAVEIRDLLQRGGPAFVYFLKITRTEPDFELDLDTDKTELSPGTSGAIFVNCFRKHGFEGDVALSVEGLPEGVTAYCDRIPSGHRDGCLILTAATNAKPAVANIVVTGRGAHKFSNGTVQKLVATAQPLQEVYVPGGGRGHWPVESHAVAIGVPGDLRGVTIHPTALTLKPGESARIDVTIDRAPGFTDNVTLSARFDHLSSIFGDTLPRGVTVDTKTSRTLLTGRDNHGIIMLHAARDTEPMAKRAVSIMANVSINFAMKSTYSSLPLFVTTLKK